jgi:hypothetical protein
MCPPFKAHTQVCSVSSRLIAGFIKSGNVAGIFTGSGMLLPRGYGYNTDVL